MIPYTRPEAPPILGANIEPFKFYVATNSDQRPDGEFPFWVNLCEGRRVAWGLSVWRGRPGYRTLGLYLEDWLARPGNAAIVIREDRDRRLDERARKVAPVGPRPDPLPGDALRLARERSGHTMGDLARFLDVPVALVSAIERGNVGVLRAYLEAHGPGVVAIDGGAL